jgi:diacylglycerol O-acyltransferase
MADTAPAVMQLSSSDSLWLNMDSPENLMVIETVMWFHHRLDPDAVVRAIQERVVDRYPVFHWRPRSNEAVGGKDEWIDDTQFDIHRHVTEHELGGEGGRVALQQFIEEKCSEPIDRNHALWRCYILQGIDFGAVMIRFHHAIADGTALARVLIELTSDAPEEGFDYPEVPEDRVHPADAPGGAEVAPESRRPRRKRERVLKRATQAATLPVAAGIKATEGTAKLLEMLDLDRPGSMVAKASDQGVGTADTLDKLLVGTAPDVALFGKAGIDKRADWAPAHDLATVKRAAKSRGATVNDLMLAGLAGGLRRYLAGRNEPIADVVTMIPVNLRPVDEPLPPHLGNRFALVALNLPLEVEDPVERLDAAHERMEVIKAGPEVLLTFGIATTLGKFGTYTARVTRRVNEYFGNKAIGVTTNVPGPQHPRYLAGQEMVGILGWVPGAGDQSVGACIFSYNNEIRVGFKTDANAVPDIANLVAAYTAEMEELLALGAE